MNKNIVSLFVLGILFLSALSFVVADNDDKGYPEESLGDHIQTQNESQIQDRVHVENQSGEGNPNLIMGNNGSQIQNRAEERKEFKIHGQNVYSNLNMSFYEDANRTQSRIRVNLSNGTQREIKVLPETAAERAREVFRNQNMTLVLKEVPNGNNSTLVYEAESNSTMAIFGLFKVRANLRTQIDADNGDIIETSKPWWSFLASSVEEN